MKQYFTTSLRCGVMLRLAISLAISLAVGCDRAPSHASSRAPTASTSQPIAQNKQPDVMTKTAESTDPTLAKIPPSRVALNAAANTNARWQALQAKAEARHDALDRFITRPGLVMTITPASRSPSDALPASMTMALSLKSVSAMGYQGTGWCDGSAPAKAAVQLTLVPTAEGLIQSFKIHIDPPVTPSGQRLDAPQGEVTFHVVPVNQGLDLQGSMTLGNTTSPLRARVTLKHDRPRQHLLVERYHKEAIHVEKLTQPLVDALKDFAILRSRNRAVGKAVHQPDQIILVRQHGHGGDRVQWNGEAQWWDITTRTFHQVKFDAAMVVVEKNRAVLVIPTAGRLYRLTLEGGFTGQWFSPTGKAHPVAMDLAVAQDSKAHQAQLQAQQRQLQAITPQTSFRGVVPVATAKGSCRWSPVEVRLEMMSQGRVAATAVYTQDRVRVLMRGSIVTTLTGPAVTLALDHIPAGQLNMRIAPDILAMQLKGQRWTLHLADTGPTSRFIGRASGLSWIPFELEQAGAIWQAKYHTLMEQWLAGGETTLEMTWPASGKKSEAPLVMVIKLDKTDGSIRGRVVSGGQALHLQGSYTLKGQLTPDSPDSPVTPDAPDKSDSWPGLSLELVPTGDHVSSPVYTMDLVFARPIGRAMLCGMVYPTLAPQAPTRIEFQQASR